MSRFETDAFEATENNKHEGFPVPTSGRWKIAYGKDHTAMGFFIDFVPLDEEAKKQCSVSYDGREEPDDEPAPMEEWEYNPISLDQLFTPGFDFSVWFSILKSFEIRHNIGTNEQ